MFACSSNTHLICRPPNFTHDYGRICFYTALRVGWLAEFYVQKHQQMRVSNRNPHLSIAERRLSSVRPNPLQAKLCTHNVISPRSERVSLLLSISLDGFQNFFIIPAIRGRSVGRANNMIH